jgi:hypothetical protein
MKKFAGRVLLLCAAVGIGHSALAQSSQPHAVIELFTSQGCSSCPPADALFVDLAKDPSVIALTLPVDYWDYLGWKDTLASPAFSSRQKNYALLRGDGNVYTPQAVVNGGAHVVGSDQRAVKSASASATLPIRISATESAGVVRLSVGEGTAALRSGTIFVLPVVRSREVAIGRGENKSRTVTYANVVRGITRVGEWAGESIRFEVPVSLARGDADGYVVLLQSDTQKPGGSSKPGTIIGAYRSPGLSVNSQ